LRIVQYFPGVVPPPTYGGIERMVHWITRELERVGHDVTVIADRRSTIAQAVPGVTLIPIPDDCDDWRTLLPGDADVIHIHNQPKIPLPEAPFIITEHGHRTTLRAYPPNMVFLSRTHAANHHSDVYVYNGIPVEEYELQRTKEPFMLFMAKLSWKVKNAKTAFHLSFDSGFPLKAAGGDLWGTPKLWGGWTLRAPFHKGLLTDVGSVGGAQKLGLLQDAKLLYYLVKWDEPFALAPHEAMACGTPVLASPNGALTEYLRHGENGFFASTYKEALQIVNEVAAMGPQETAAMADRCRASAFSIEDCVQGYLRLYERVIAERYLYPPEQCKSIYLRRPRSTKVRRLPFMI
jgi:glycosyltransferase involved in cell wall biosynthesis